MNLHGERNVSPEARPARRWRRGTLAPRDTERGAKIVDAARGSPCSAGRTCAPCRSRRGRVWTGVFGKITTSGATVKIRSSEFFPRGIDYAHQLPWSSTTSKTCSISHWSSHLTGGLLVTVHGPAISEPCCATVHSLTRRKGWVRS